MNKRILFFLILAVLCPANRLTAGVAVSNLKCEMLENPLGIDTATPRLSWEIHSDQNDVRQTGVDILVSSTPELLSEGHADLWNAHLDTDETLYVPYKGKKLGSRSRCYWKVRVHTNKGSTEWSEMSLWSVGLLSEREWRANWIGCNHISEQDSFDGSTRLAARYLRKEFKTKGVPVKRATLYIIGLGLYEAYINGSRIGTQVLSPTLTNYSMEVKYNTFDLTDSIQSGRDNALGVVLGNGRYFSTRQNLRSGWLKNFGLPTLFLQLEIEYEDGTTGRVYSNDSWKVTTDGPIRANNEYDGEVYDARKELGAWTSPLMRTVWLKRGMMRRSPSINSISCVEPGWARASSSEATVLTAIL